MIWSGKPVPSPIKSGTGFCGTMLYHRNGKRAAVARFPSTSLDGGENPRLPSGAYCQAGFGTIGARAPCCFIGAMA